MTIRRDPTIKCSGFLDERRTNSSRRSLVCEMPLLDVLGHAGGLGIWRSCAILELARITRKGPCLTEAMSQFRLFQTRAFCFVRLVENKPDRSPGGGLEFIASCGIRLGAHGRRLFYV